MKFWKGNRVDGELEMPVGEVASAFCTAVTGNCLAVCGIAAHHPECTNPWKDKLCAWPLERTLRDWLTSPDGFNASWEAETGEDSFEELFETARGQFYGRGDPDYSINHVD